MLTGRIFGAVILSLFIACGFGFVLGLFGTVIYWFIDPQNSLSQIFSSENSASFGERFINTGALIGGGIGVLVGIGVFITSIQRILKVDRLEKGGIRLSTTVMDIQKRHVSHSGTDGSLSTSDTIYTVTTEWIDPRTSQRHQFKGESRAKPAVGPGGYVVVLVSPDSFQEYHMEL